MFAQLALTFSLSLSLSLSPPHLSPPYSFVCMERNITARDIMSAEAFENATTMVYALGGSTNAYLHLLALARECDLEDVIHIDRLHEIGKKF